MMNKWLKMIFNGYWGSSTFAILLFLSVSCSPAPQLKPRNSHWTKPSKHEGLGNFYEVTSNLYRGSQPDQRGFQTLSAIGIRTIVNLRIINHDTDEIQKAGLDKARFNLERIPMFSWRLRDKDIVQFLKIAIDPGKQPVFVHCQHGSDRTGAMIAAYRMVIQGWTAEQAIAEMTGNKYGFHKIWWNLPRHIKNLDVERIRRELATGHHLDLSSFFTELKMVACDHLGKCNLFIWLSGPALEKFLNPILLINQHDNTHSLANRKSGIKIELLKV
jgi:tyrosine-protein phosphatase SIW14